MHERVVRVLTKDDESLHPDVVLQLARHCALAGLPEEALVWSVSAGDYAFEHLAPTEATHHYQVALAATEALHRPDAQRADLLVRLGHAQFRAGDPEAQANLVRGAKLARDSGQRQTLIRAALVAELGVPRLHSLAREHSEVVESALEVADPADTATYARLLALLSESLTFAPDVGAAGRAGSPGAASGRGERRRHVVRKRRTRGVGRALGPGQPNACERRWRQERSRPRRPQEIRSCSSASISRRARSRSNREIR